MVERKDPPPQPSRQALHSKPERCHLTLASIGDAVMTMDKAAQITFLNSVAESLTDWVLQDAAVVAVETVFRLVNENTRNTVERPTVRARGMESS